MLLDVGYIHENIEMKDISSHVFEPLTKYLDERERLLHSYGWGLGKLVAAKWLFGWWAKSGVVKGMIIVAKSEPNNKVY